MAADCGCFCLDSVADTPDPSIGRRVRQVFQELRMITVTMLPRRRGGSLYQKADRDRWLISDSSPKGSRSRFSHWPMRASLETKNPSKGLGRAYAANLSNRLCIAMAIFSNGGLCTVPSNLSAHGAYREDALNNSKIDFSKPPVFRRLHRPCGVQCRRRRCDKILRAVVKHLRAGCVPSLLPTRPFASRLQRC